MNRSRLFFFLASLTLVLPILAGTLLLAADTDAKKPEDDSFYKYLGVFSEVLSRVRQEHVDEPDVNTLMAGVLEGTTDALDAFSFYVPPADVAGYAQAVAVDRQRSGALLLKEHGVAYVVAVDPGSPAAAAGVQGGDIVALVNGVTTRTMPLWKMREALAGPAGSQVDLELLRLGAPVKMSLKLGPYAVAVPELTETDGVPVLRIPSFDATTAEKVEPLLAKAKGKDGLVIDLRHVATGDPRAAYATAELFADGDLGTLTRRGQAVETFRAKRPPVWQGKRLVVLVNRTTLGAAEVLSAILHQKLKADLVGERTFGHAGKLGVADLSNGGKLYFTEAFFAGPDAKPLSESQQPDLSVDRTRSFVERNVPLDDLILKRGIDRLQGRDKETAVEKKAA
jgi:carboxyl-terminal processing protease